MPRRMSDPRRNKIRFRASHRGFREADLILGAFAELHVEGFSDAELDTFEALIDQPDHDLYAWIVGQAEPPADLAGDMLERLQAFRHTLNAVRGDDRGA